MRAQGITLKSILLGLVLAIVLAASTTYVGLKVGRTISGSIPAAILSIMLLRCFGRTNIFEHNIVQTTASAGEVVSAGMIFTIPAMVIIGYWQSFSYWETTLIALVGGLLGVAFSIPLRRVLLIEHALPYPEGVAVAQIMQTKSVKEGGKMLIYGSIISAITVALQEAFHILSGGVQYWFRIQKAAFGFGCEFSPVLLGAGYLVGIRIALQTLFGVLLTWGVIVPIYSCLYNPFMGLEKSADIAAAVVTLWKDHIRYIGIGAMFVGGIHAVSIVLPSLRVSLKSAIHSIEDGKMKYEKNASDIPLKYVLLAVLGLGIATYLIYSHFLSEAHLSPYLHYTLVMLATGLTLLVAFIGAANAGYLTGTLGSTNTPVSGILISSVLIFASILILINKLFSLNIHFGNIPSAEQTFSGAGITIVFATLVALTSCLSSDNMQDLKAGAILGATPWRQQVMLCAGVAIASIVIAPILQLLYEAYGFAGSTPHPNMDKAATFPAQSAAFCAVLAEGIFAGTIEYHMLSIGIGLGLLFLISNHFTKKYNKGFLHIPIQIVASGMYLPLAYVIPFIIGGVISHYTARKMPALQKGETNSMLFASGVIAGNALIGVLIAIPLAQGFDFNAISPHLPENITTALGTAAFMFIGWKLYSAGLKIIR